MRTSGTSILLVASLFLAILAVVPAMGQEGSANVTTTFAPLPQGVEELGALNRAINQILEKISAHGAYTELGGEVAALGGLKRAYLQAVTIGGYSGYELYNTLKEINDHLDSIEQSADNPAMLNDFVEKKPNDSYISDSIKSILPLVESLPGGNPLVPPNPLGEASADEMWRAARYMTACINEEIIWGSSFRVPAGQERAWLLGQVERMRREKLLFIGRVPTPAVKKGVPFSEWYTLLRQMDIELDKAIEYAPKGEADQVKTALESMKSWKDRLEKALIYAK